MSTWTKIRDSVVGKITGWLWKGGPIDGAKTPLSLLFLALVKAGILPAINIDDGVTLDELLLIWAAIDAKIKAYGLFGRSD